MCAKKAKKFLFSLSITGRNLAIKLFRSLISSIFAPKWKEPNRPGVTSQVEVIVPEVGHISDSLRRCLKVASSFSLPEHLQVRILFFLEVRILCFKTQTMIWQIKLDTCNKNVSKPVPKCREVQRSPGPQTTIERVEDKLGRPELNLKTTLW